MVSLRRPKGLDLCHLNLGYFLEIVRNTPLGVIYIFCAVQVKTYGSLFHHFFTHYGIDQSVLFLITVAFTSLHFHFIAYHSAVLNIDTMDMKPLS